jgi:hypothetical protein
MLSEKGCGVHYLRALANSLEVTRHIIGTETLDTYEGVRQGGPLSCALFTFYLDITTERVNQYGPDGYLGNLHSLLLMDDTAIIATTREAMARKLALLLACTNQINMKMHPTKCEYLAINADDRSPFSIGNSIIEHTNAYKYLGATITTDTLKSQVELHAKLATASVNKFYAFLYKNNDAPYQVKKKVLDSCVTSTLLYSCESWLTNNLQPIAKIYNSCLKQLLGVRSQTANDVVYVETGMPSITSVVKERQRQFYNNLGDDADRPINKAIKIARNQMTPTAKYLLRLLAQTSDYRSTDIADRNELIRSSLQSKIVTYRSINPSLTVHPIYASNIPEQARKAATQMRTSSHNLKIETGRWSRTLRENRLCQCGHGVQDETHVLTSCQLTENLHPPFSSTTEAMENNNIGFICLNIFNRLKEL